MKPSYDNLILKPGVANAGLSKIQIAPKEWLSAPLVFDFSTGAILTAIALTSGKSFYELQFTPFSYDFDEKNKTNKSGDYIETTIQGQINDLDQNQLQVIETFRRSELIVLATDRQKRRRVIGNQEYGMIFSFDSKNTNNPNGALTAKVSLVFDSESYSPFYP